MVRRAGRRHAREGLLAARQLSAAALLVAACGVDPGGTHVAGTEDQPAPGSVEVEGDPPQAATPLVIQFVGAEGGVVEETTARIPAGGTIKAGMPNLPGVMRLLVNGNLCEFAIESDRRTRVALRIRDAGCSVETKGIDPV